MGSRPFAIFAFTVLAAGVVFVGCGGGGGEPAATATPTPAATATSLPTPVAAASPIGAALPLDEYLVLTLRIEANMNRLDVSFPSLQEDPEGFRLRASLASERMLGSLASGERGDLLIEIYQDALIYQKKGDLRSAARRYETILAEMGKGRADILDRVSRNWSAIQSYRQESN